MPRRTDIKRVLVIGSGPIVIGQACDFDYSGTQAGKGLRSRAREVILAHGQAGEFAYSGTQAWQGVLDEGLEVILLNSHPATIMTDPEIADKPYVEPLT